jgi:hypothetical protein
MTDKGFGLVDDVAGVVQNPGQTLARLMNEKKWLPVFLLLVITAVILTAITYSLQVAAVSQHAQQTGYISQDEAVYYLNTSTFSRIMICGFTAFMLSLGLIAGAFFVYLFFGIGGAEGVYANYFALVTNASIIDTLFPALLHSLSLLTKTPFTALSTPFLVFSSGGPLMNLILARLDIFEIWYMLAIAAGVRVFARLSVKRSLVIAGFYFLFKSLVAVGFGYLAMQIMPRG